MDKKKNIVIVALLAVIALMTTGYAALAQVLDINGTANISADWAVEITNIELASSTGATNTDGVAPTYDATSATFAVDLAYPGATATYDVTIENKGTIDAKLSSISGVEAANALQPAEIQYEVTGVTVNDKLASEGKAVAHVKVTWVSATEDTIPTATSKTATITLNYVQDTN